jgi:ABC-type Mn2+/Zn2+ transport system permease subunit
MKDSESWEERAEAKADRQYGLVWRIMFAIGILVVVLTVSAIEIINALKG